MTIGVLIATFNSTRYLEATLESVTGQRRAPDQVILVDDNSTDDTRDICAAWAAKQSFEVIQLVNSSRAGLPAAGRDRGLRAASTDLLALLDHDDLFLPENLERLERGFATEPDLALCFADAREFQGDPSEGRSILQGKQLDRVPYREGVGGLRKIESGFFESLLIASYVPTMANLWRRDAAIEAGGFSMDAGSADDAHLWMRLGRLGGVAYFPKILGCKRTHDDNITHPRNALPLSMSQYRAIRDVLKDASRWNLSERERAASEARMSDLAGEILYHASRAGFAAYRQTRREIGDKSIRPKHLLVSLARSIGLL